jgi:hypothetical protein
MSDGAGGQSEAVLRNRSREPCALGKRDDDFNVTDCQVKQRRPSTWTLNSCCWHGAAAVDAAASFNNLLWLRRINSANIKIV